MDDAGTPIMFGNMWLYMARSTCGCGRTCTCVPGMPFMSIAIVYIAIVTLRSLIILPSFRHMARCMSVRSPTLAPSFPFQSLSSYIIGHFQDFIKQHMIVTLYLTMLVGAGGNAGAQRWVVESSAYWSTITSHYSSTMAPANATHTR